MDEEATGFLKWVMGQEPCSAHGQMDRRTIRIIAYRIEDK